MRLTRLSVLVGCLLVAAGCADAVPEGTTIEKDLAALQGEWRDTVPSPNVGFYFRFDKQTVAFAGTGVLDTLPAAKEVPFEIKEADRKRFIELAEQGTPTGIGRRIGYQFDGDQLVLTVEEWGKPKTYKVSRVKKEK
jgi:hypothetical protein